MNPAHGPTGIQPVGIAGRGRVRGDDETREVGPSDSIPSKLGGSHGIFNDTQDDLELLGVAVCAEKGQFDFTDLGDELSSR